MATVQYVAVSYCHTCLHCHGDPASDDELCGRRKKCRDENAPTGKHDEDKRKHELDVTTSVSHGVKMTGGRACLDLEALVVRAAVRPEALLNDIQAMVAAFLALGIDVREGWEARQTGNAALPKASVLLAVAPCKSQLSQTDKVASDTPATVSLTLTLGDIADTEKFERVQASEMRENEARAASQLQPETCEAHNKQSKNDTSRDADAAAVSAAALCNPRAATKQTPAENGGKRNKQRREESSENLGETSGTIESIPASEVALENEDVKRHAQTKCSAEDPFTRRRQCMRNT
eukprot:TRINITY_DN22786_c0_g1_i1.p1 TRINITY_DN22786_c0_g1~~TRINITY_DN22786_c0_g1_i1.p1  ORF type:complete len:292 (-),score=50.92 TRINITY_DN22786_c0_g1_i1:191-1066(-)